MKISAMTIVLLALLICPASPARADWPQQGFDSQRSSFNPNEGLLGKNNVGELKVLWTNSVPCTINSGPTNANGVVYYGHYCGEFRAVDADTGATIWTQSINRTETGNAVVDGIVYVTARCTYDYCGMVYAFNATTGTTLWTWDPGPTEVRRPVVSDGVVYVTTTTDLNVWGIHALDAKTGNEIWSVSPGGIVAVANGVVYTTTIESNPNSLLALDTGNGDLLWTGLIDGSYDLSRPTVVNSFVYVSSSDGYLYTFKAGGCGSDECLPLWRGLVSVDGYNSSQPSAVAEEKVYVGAGDSLYAFDASGCGDSECLPLWTTKTSCSFFSNPPSIANGVVYSTCDNNYIYAFDALTGEVLWQYYTSGGYEMRASPAISDGRLFHAATFDFNLYAFSLPEARDDDGLVAYYPFNGNANDESENGNHGTVHGATLTEDRFGNPNSAYAFDGNSSFIEIIGNVINPSSITITAWFKKELNKGGWEDILSGLCGTPILTLNNNEPSWGSQCDSPIKHRFAGFDISFSKWHFIAGTYNGSSLKLYYDGVKVIDDVETNSFVTISPVYIGATPPLPGYEFFQGAIDEILIYNRALSEDEIKMLSGIQNPDNGHWYQGFDNSMTWHDAKEYCKSMGGYLATITSQQENDFVFNNLVNPSGELCWLGGTDEDVEGNWQWITGEAWEYSNWDVGEPNDYCGGEDYLHMTFWTDTWNDEDNDGSCGEGEGLDYLICEWGDYNLPPEADAGSNQTVVEGETVTLDGSNSSDPDGDTTSYQWTQIDGIPVPLSDPTVAKPTFVTPVVSPGGMILTFELVVKDEGDLQDSDEVTITVDDNGIDGFPDDVLTMICSTGKEIGIKVESGGDLVSITAVDPATIPDSSDKPDDFPYGLFDLLIKTSAVGGTAKVTFYLESKAGNNDKWSKHKNSTGKWEDCSAYASCNAARDQFTITLVDGGDGDDGPADGWIVDPSGLSSPATTTTSGGGGGGGGCFIATAADG